MPSQVKTIRVLMFVAAGWAVLVAVAIFVAEGATAIAIGGALYVLIPATASFILALRIPRGGKPLRRGIIALEIVYALLALGSLAQGDPRGLPQLILPGLVLFLITRPQASEHFRRN